MQIKIVCSYWLETVGMITHSVPSQYQVLLRDDNTNPPTYLNKVPTYLPT